MSTVHEAKKQLDKIIKKSRVHLYKPIQIAEILKKHREQRNFELSDVESYRNVSKKWRDQVSLRLVGRICTSSQKFQDNIFESNAMPPNLLAILGEENVKSDRAGIVEAYIYLKMGQKMEILKTISDYVTNATPDNFKLDLFLKLFTLNPGLKRSIDKAYEITVFALFSALVKHLGATVSLEIPKDRIDLLREFEGFTKIVLGITCDKPEIVLPAKLYRVGVANAADRGLDMWSNFGPAVQVKHLSLTEDLAEGIVNQVSADRIVIVCKSAEKQVLERILTQLGFSTRIQGIITENDLEKWYLKCFSKKYSSTLGVSLLNNLRIEFSCEFPSTGTDFEKFVNDNGYDKIIMTGIWETKITDIEDMVDFI